MAELSNFLAKKRYAVVTGANKGIGFEVCRQLAAQGVVVVLTSRDEKRGLEAIENLKNSGIKSENLHYHRLDVTDTTSVASLADSIGSMFGKLDILVNNAGINGVKADYDALEAAGFGKPGMPMDTFAEMMTQTYELAKECLETNYYGVKKTTEVLLPLLKLSDSPRIINVSSSMGKLQHIPNERIKAVLGDAENLTEEKIDEILNAFLRDMKDGSFKDKGWPSSLAAYIVSKAALNAYTRIFTKKHTSIIINCVCPGFVRTDISRNMGQFSVEEGAASPVKLALVPHGSPSGLFYFRSEVSSFE